MCSTAEVVQLLLAVTGCGLAIVGSPFAPMLPVTLVRYRKSMAAG